MLYQYNTKQTLGKKYYVNFIMMKGSIHQENITINMYAPNNTGPKYMK